MKRPLAWFCLCLVMLAGFRLYKMGQESDKWREKLSLADSCTMTVTGRVYEKKENQIYIESVLIQECSANLQNEFPKEINLICECDNGEEFSLGSMVEVKGIYRCFREATNPGEFDAYGYYLSQNIVGKLRDVQVAQLNGKNVECYGLLHDMCGYEGRREVVNDASDYRSWCELVCDACGYWELRELLYDLRTHWEGRLYELFPEKEASIMCTMLLGNKDVLDSKIKESFQQNGIAHILSISGLHITIIGMGIYEMLRRIGIAVKPAGLLGVIVLLLYGIMTGMSVSTCRAIGMYVIRMFGEIVGRTYDGLTSVAVIGAIMVCGVPYYLTNCGFLLSYGAILGIYIVCPMFEELDTKMDGKMNAKIGGTSFARKEWIKTLRASIGSSLSVTLATLPIQLWFFYEIPVYSILLNLLVVPLMSVVMVSGLLSIFLPIGNEIVAYLPYGILKWYEYICNVFDGLPFHTWNPGKPEVWQVVVYYVLLFVVVKWKSWGEFFQYVKKWKAWENFLQIVKKWKIWENLLLHVEKNKILKKILWYLEKMNRYIQRAGLSVVAQYGTLTIAVIILGNAPNTGNMLTVLDVGQGDGICLETKEGEVYLFDCGSTSRSGIGQYVLVPFLKYNGIQHIEAAFISHPDEDHCNGILELLALVEEEHITIDRIVLPAIAEVGRTQAFADIWSTVEEYDCKGTSENPTLVQYIGSGDSWEVGDWRFTCLHPRKGTALEDANAYSECFYVEGSNGFSLLLTGDVEKEGEEELLEQLRQHNIDEITLLKVAHHGSRYSSAEAFLEQIRPKVAVISCGESNRYGHPHAETLERLESVGSQVLTTPEYGAITVEISKSVKVYGWLKPTKQGTNEVSWYDE